MACQNINECLDPTDPHKCDGNADCTDNIGSYTCCVSNRIRGQWIHLYRFVDPSYINCCVAETNALCWKCLLQCKSMGRFVQNACFDYTAICCLPLCGNLLRFIRKVLRQFVCEVLLLGYVGELCEGL